MGNPEQAANTGQIRTSSMASRVAAASGRPVPGLPEGQPAMGAHPHGRPSSWLLIGLVIAAFLAGGAAIILHLWWLLFTCAGVAVLAIPVGKATGIMNDTVVWGATGPDEQAPGSSAR